MRPRTPSSGLGAGTVDSERKLRSATSSGTDSYVNESEGTICSARASRFGTGTYSTLLGVGGWCK